MSAVRKIKAVVEYDGTRYAGFQEQPDQPTIQGEIERVLATITRQETKVVGAGRTDAGVHARGQVVHFVTGWTRSLEELQRGCNALLPNDIAVREMAAAAPDFHARFSADSREYRYTVLNQEVRSPLEERYAYHYARPLDAEAMGEALTHLIGRHDYASFGRAPHGDNTAREVRRASCSREGNHIYFDLTADAFLRQMVRTIVGTVLTVGTGARSPADMNLVLQTRDRSLASPPTPARGLCLLRVNYRGVEE